jgi:hypothetical protein
MEFKYSEINDLASVLKKVIMTCNLPIKNMATIHRLVKDVNAEIIIHQDLYQGLITKFSEKDESGNPVRVTKDDKDIGIKISDPEAFAEKMKELEDTEFSISYSPISLDLFQGLEVSFREFEIFNEKLFI